MLTVDEELKPLSVPVRVGQAVDVVGQAGRPKTITGFQTHSTPVLLAAGERAELATDKYITQSLWPSSLHAFLFWTSIFLFVMDKMQENPLNMLFLLWKTTYYPSTFNPLSLYPRLILVLFLWASLRTPPIFMRCWTLSSFPDISRSRQYSKGLSSWRRILTIAMITKKHSLLVDRISLLKLQAPHGDSAATRAPKQLGFSSAAFIHTVVT